MGGLAMTALRAWMLGMLVLLAQGCASFQGAPQWDPAALKSDDALFEQAVGRFFGTSSLAERASVRNEYMTRRMAQIDRAYLEYKQGLYAQRVGSAVGIDVATLALTGAAAAVSDVGTKTGASALAALLTGSKTSVDKNVYFDRTLPALLTQMDALRAEARARLFAGALLSADRYALSEADADLSEYRQAGTVHRAIAAVTNQAGQAQAAAEKLMRDRLPSEQDLRTELTRKGFVVQAAAMTSTTEQLQKCVLLDGSLDPGVDPAFKTWFATAQPAWAKTLPKDSLPPSITPVSDFMSTAAYEPLRQQALADPTLGPLLKSCK